MMEIGATCVGACTPLTSQVVTKGDEKRLFLLFGGSCVATLFAAGRLQIDPDLLQQGAQGREVYAPMGTRIGQSLKIKRIERQMRSRPATPICSVRLNLNPTIIG